MWFKIHEECSNCHQNNERNTNDHCWIPTRIVLVAIWALLVLEYKQCVTARPVHKYIYMPIWMCVCVWIYNPHICSVFPTLLLVVLHVQFSLFAFIALLSVILFYLITSIYSKRHSYNFKFGGTFNVNYIHSYLAPWVESIAKRAMVWFLCAYCIKRVRIDNWAMVLDLDIMSTCF